MLSFVCCPKTKKRKRKAGYKNLSEGRNLNEGRNRRTNNNTLANGTYNIVHNKKEKKTKQAEEPSAAREGS